MIDACSPCLRRSHLVAHLAPRIAGILAEVPRRRVPALLALDDDALIRAVAGSSAERARSFLESFDSVAALARLEAAGVGALCVHADRYPQRLRDPADRPATLFWVGVAEGLDALEREPSVAVVGARRASAYGLEVAYALGRGLGAAGVPVVSGMALGIDAASHRGALDGRGPAVAVLACGPELAYPRANRGLHLRLCEAGAVVSEHPPGQRVLRWSFPARNRIMAALADLVVVVEAAEGSGSLITASIAADLGRSVAAVPGRTTHRGAAGSNRLMRDGAIVARGAEDVLDELSGEPGRPRRPPSDRATEGALDPRERQVLDEVEAGMGGVDAVGRALGLSAGAVRAALGRLEGLGLVVRDGLGAYERTAR